MVPLKDAIKEARRKNGLATAQKRYYEKHKAEINERNRKRRALKKEREGNA